MADFTGPKPHLATTSDIASGSTTVADSVTATSFLTIPAGKTFVGHVTVIATSRATTAVTGSARVRVNGAGATPANGSDILIATSARDTASCTATQLVRVTAPPASSCTLDLVNNTATTFNGTASANGVFL